MAAAAAGQDKKRLSKALKKKSKKQVPVEEEETTPAAVEEAAPVDVAAADMEEGTADMEGADEVPEAEAEAEGAKAAKKVKSKARRLEEMEAEADEEPVEPKGVIYVGHIPDGFFEPQMKKFFGQFGTVTRLRISRSAKNAKSKGYGFVEFEEESVAKIVAETMHKYMLFGKTLVCHLMTKDKQHPMLFKNCKKPMVNLTGVRHRKHRSTFNERPMVEVDGKQIPKRSTRQEERRSKSDKKLKSVLANLGVDYDLKASVDDAAEGSGVAAGLSKAKASPASGAEPEAAAGATDASTKKKTKKRKTSSAK